MDTFVSGDVKSAAERLLMLLDDPAAPAARPAGAWRAEARKRLAEGPAHHPGAAETPDGRLDPRSLAKALDAVLPERRTVVQDGGHFIGWAPMYFDIPSPDRLVMVGTAYQSIGLGFPSAVGAAAAGHTGTTVLCTGDGGGLMALPDLDTVIRTVPSGVIVVFNDAAYGAEVHQYGSRGLDQTPMLIDEVDFAALARALGGQGVTVDTLADLDGLTDWVHAGAQGVLLLDCRISTSVVAPYLSEMMQQGPRPVAVD